jgi:hypothetical protein
MTDYSSQEKPTRESLKVLENGLRDIMTTGQNITDRILRATQQKTKYDYSIVERFKELAEKHKDLVVAKLDDMIDANDKRRGPSKKAVNNLVVALDDMLDRIDQLCEDQKKIWSEADKKSDDSSDDGKDEEYDDQESSASPFHAMAKAANHLDQFNPKHEQFKIPDKNVNYTNEQKHELLSYSYHLTSRMLRDLADNSESKNAKRLYTQHLEQQNEMGALLDTVNNYVDSAKSKLTKVRESVTGQTAKLSGDYKADREEKKKSDDIRKTSRELGSDRDRVKSLRRKLEAQKAEYDRVKQLNRSDREVANAKDNLLKTQNDTKKQVRKARREYDNLKSYGVDAGGEIEDGVEEQTFSSKHKTKSFFGEMKRLTKE